MSTQHVLPPLTISADGYIRLTIEALRAIPLTHLVSGLDQASDAATSTDAVATDITGFTEWVSQDTPAISIGWDWLMTSEHGKSQLRALNYPRSNLMLMQNSSSIDVGQRENLLILKSFVDELLWRDEVLAYLSKHFSL